MKMTQFSCVISRRVLQRSQRTSVRTYMTDELRQYLKGGYLGLVHRLDQPVEGILVCAKTPEAAAALSRDIQHGNTTTGKTYYAVCCWTEADRQRLVTDTTVILTDYLVKDVKTNLSRVASQGEREAKKAVLSYETVAVREDHTALLRVHLDTGRHHQIRVQLAHIGLPILGDLKYGTPESCTLAQQLHVEQVALCAYELSFRHPVTHRMMTYTIEPEASIFHQEP